MEIFSFVEIPTETNLLKRILCIYKNILYRSRNPSLTQQRSTENESELSKNKELKS